MSERVAALILAAGQGKRMKSERSKVLLEFRGEPLIRHVVAAARGGGAERITVVVGFDRERVIAALPDGVAAVHQVERLGTGHAVRMAEESFLGFEGVLVVLSGDVPGIRPETVRALARMTDRDAACAVLSFEVEGAHTYGRIVRDKAGRVQRIVEHREAAPAERAIREVNSGIYAFRAGKLFEALREVKDDNAAGEYYLTDVIRVLVARGEPVEVVKLEDPVEVLGVNTPEDLERVKAAWLGRRS